ncbi:MAG: hypothetical protein VYD87_11015 [Pseudomonadota bacterium]|nr:hypothetical protein [Pseudomonadota bacterium]MEE3099720.1 hypothetical protein [Pseudomonadota bacterium]
MTNETTRALAEADAAIRRIKRRTTRSQTVRGVTLGPLGPAREPLIAADLDAGFETEDGTLRRRREAVAVRRSGRVLAMLPLPSRAAANRLAGLVEQATAPKVVGELTSARSGRISDGGAVARSAALAEVRTMSQLIGEARIIGGRVPVFVVVWSVVIREMTLADTLRAAGIAHPRRKDLVETRDALVAALDRIAGWLAQNRRHNPW